MTFAFLSIAPATAKTTLDIKTQPPGATVKAMINYPKTKTLGECVSPCRMKIPKIKPDWVDYRMVIEKPDYIPAEFLGVSGQTIDGVVHFKVELETLASMQARIEAERLAHQQQRLDTCAQKLAKIVEADMDVSACDRHMPNMPPRAAARGIEGYCDISFSVDTNGLPQKVVAKFCSDIMFESASVNSVTRSIYFPKRINGESVESENILQRISFRLAE